ncbi:hypothetical protein EMCRGX_G000426 [Ephydatia muelleri]
MLKELALLVTLLTLLADARPQRFEKPLNDLDKMSEEVDINGPLTFDDDIRENSESLTFQGRGHPKQGYLLEAFKTFITVYCNPEQEVLDCLYLCDK